MADGRSPVRSDSQKAVVVANPLLAAPPRVASDPDDLVGLVLADRYALLRIIGSGGMGYVYLAQHVAIDKFVAVKVLGSTWARQQEYRTRFLREAKACSLVAHENVVEIHDFGETPNASVFMTMELLQGEHLGDLLAREGPLPWHRAKGIVLQVCRALHAAHDKGVLHRDVKPENAFRTKRGANRDFIKVIDFGIAKIVGDELDPHSSLTQAGTVFGTPEYMSPEQARGRPVDARTDVYSTGILLYELVTGQLPFTGANALDVLTKVAVEPPTPPRLVAPNAEISADLEDVILRAIRKDASERFQSIREFADALIGVSTTAKALRPATSLRGDVSPTEVGPQPRVNAALVVAVAVLALVVLILSLALVLVVHDRG